MLAALEQSLSYCAEIENLKLTYDLTLKPDKGDIFTHVPASERASYLRYVSIVYKITFSHPNKSFTIYLFVRNAKDFNHAYTRLSSIELGYIQNKQFISFFKRHFVNDMLNVSSLEFNTLEEMKAAARTVRDIINMAIYSEVQSCLIPSI
jgi:hypothetical protein